MPYNGPERRKENQGAGFCEQHMEFVSDMSEIKTSLKNIESGIVGSASFKRSLVVSIIGVFVVVIIQIVTFAFMFGVISGKVDSHSAKIAILETQSYDLNYEKGRAVGLAEAKDNEPKRSN